MSPRLESLRKRQLGLFTRRQAADCGYSTKQIRQRLASGEWHVVIGRVLAPAGLVVTPRVRDRAAQLAVAGSVLAGPAAARCWGIPVSDPRPCLAIAPNQHPKVGGIRYQRTTIERPDVGTVDGAGLTSRPRTVVDCLRLLPEAEALRLLDKALQLRWIELDDLVRRVQRMTGRHGVRRLHRLLGRVAAGSRSAAERVAAALLRQAGIEGWAANVVIGDANGVIGVADIAFDRERLVIELDGLAFHAKPDQFQRDRERQNRLVGAGWFVLRFTWWDLTERPEYVIATIRAMLARLSTSSPR